MNTYWLNRMGLGIILVLGLGACSMSNTGDEVDAQLNTGYFTARNVEADACLRLNQSTRKVTTGTCDRNDPEKLWRFTEQEARTVSRNGPVTMTKTVLQSRLGNCLWSGGSTWIRCSDESAGDAIYRDNGNRTILNSSGKCLTWTRGRASTSFQSCTGSNAQQWVLN